MHRTYSLLFLASLAACTGVDRVLADDQKTEFDKLKSKKWNEVFSDSCRGAWQDKWFLDGEKAKVTNDDEAMTIDTANGYAVLWTKQSFHGDMRIEYDFKRVDSIQKGVNIIYIQATGDGQGECVADISEWCHLRKSAAMKDYYNNMHTYHISYATATKSKKGKSDYIRGRRYLPTRGKKMKGTPLSGEMYEAGIFSVAGLTEERAGAQT